jgi:hypothetical protein
MTRFARLSAAAARLTAQGVRYLRSGRWAMRRVRGLMLVEWLARAGYGARGLVHLMVGALAIMAAHEVRETAVGVQGAFEEFAGWPLGKVWLGLLALALWGFVLWRCAQAFLDADRQGRSRTALANRFGQGVSAAVYATLALSCAGVAAGIEEAGENPEVTRQQIAWVLSLPLGEIVLSSFGALVLAAGALNAQHGVFGRFRPHLTGGDDLHLWTVPLARTGYFVRGLVFLALGFFFVEAALDLGPTEAATIQGALDVVEQQPFGSLMLSALGVGLIAFGLFGFVEARYRRIVVPRELAVRRRGGSPARSFGSG